MDDFLPSGNVDGDINPFTGERITEVNASTWTDASTSELYKQLAVLEKRLQIAMTLGKVEMITQLSAAVDHLKSAINEAFNRDSKRPTRKRPNTPDQRSFRRSSSDYL